MEELLKKIQALEADHANFKQEVSKLKQPGEGRPKHNRSHSISPQRSRSAASSWKKGSKVKSGGGAQIIGPAAMKFIDILQSMGQSLHIFDRDGQIIYWNRTAEKVYGHSAAEALGRNVLELLVVPPDYELAQNISNRLCTGESWTGKFPIKTKNGDRFAAVFTNTPFYDDDGKLVGIIAISTNSRHFKEMIVPLAGEKQPEGDSNFARTKNVSSAKVALDSQQPLQVAIASKFSNLASKVSNKIKSKIKAGANNFDQEGGRGDSHHAEQGFSDAGLSNHKENTNSSRASAPRGDIIPLHFGVFSQADEKSPSKSKSGESVDESDGRPTIQKKFTSKSEQWIGKKGTWPWKRNACEGSERRSGRFAWPWVNNDQEDETGDQRNPSTGTRHEGHSYDNNPVNNEASGSWTSSININSTSTASTYGSTGSSAVHKVDAETDCLDCEILWEDLTIGVQIGQGSCGTVYHGLWYGSDVSIKVFSKQEYSEDLIYSFKEEVSLMKRLRHPNVLLFMGAVTSPQRLCIVTEFLPRGSLFHLLQRNITKLDWRRRVHMALDIAQGMNYLHHCNPPIIHRDLKSSNLLVDKNCTVKVGNFGLSRIKHETFLRTKSGKGTPQWMAPEVLRNEPSDEKSDVYSFGVILWEIATEKIPWDNLNSMQVIGAVGFMNQRLEIPKEMDPRWASIIESCWQSDPQSRPPFKEVMEKLRDLQRQFTIQLQQSRIAGGDNTNKEL